MKWFNNLKIARKLGLAFGLCLLLSLTAGAVAVVKMAVMNGNAAELMAKPFTGVTMIANTRNDMKQYRLYQYRYALTIDANGRAAIRTDLDNCADKVDRDLQDYSSFATDPEDKQNAADLQTRWNDYKAFDSQLQAATDSGNQKLAVKLLSAATFASFTKVVDEVTKIVDWNGAAGKKLSAESTQTYASARVLVIVLLAIALVAGVCLSVTVTRMITQVVAEIGKRAESLDTVCLANLGAAMKELANGNLESKIVTGTTLIDVHGDDELGVLSQSVNSIIGQVHETIATFEKAQTALKVKIDSAHEAVIESIGTLDNSALLPLCDAIAAMAAGDLTRDVNNHVDRMQVDKGSDLGKLAEAVNRVAARIEQALTNYDKMREALCSVMLRTRNSADTIAATATDLATGSEDLSSRCSEQASSLEETAASMEEMTSIVKANADNARNANEVAIKARDVAHNGGAAVQEAVVAMGAINEASKKINDIISVIDEIAFQTNLLALNAAVEAARVGEQGKGFAVVASEVRNLAGRSSTAAKEIKALVQDSVHKVQGGTQLVNKSGDVLQEIVASVNQVAEIVAEITAASQEQSVGIEQVNKAVTQMDEITQQNASLVEEAAASSETMAQQASELQNLVDTFRVDNGETVRAAPAPVKPSAPARRPQPVKQAAAAGGRSRPAATKPSLKMVAMSEEDF